MLIPVPIVVVAVRYFGRTIHSLYEIIQAALATLSAKAQENLAGVRVIRAYAQEDAEMRAFDAPNRDYVTRNLKLIGTWSMFMPALTALIGMSFRPGAVVRRPAGHLRADLAGRIGGLLRLHGSA